MSCFHGSVISSVTVPPAAVVWEATIVPLKSPLISNVMVRDFAGPGSFSLPQDNSVIIDNNVTITLVFIIRHFLAMIHVEGAVARSLKLITISRHHLEA